MYIPKHFLLEDQRTVLDFIDHYSFGSLFTHHEGHPFATHLPFVLDRNSETLYGHFARANPQWKDMAGQEALIVFQGPHAYISPSWYETNQAVPTWNYVVAHVYGTAEIIEDQDELLKYLNEMVLKYEGSDSDYRIDASNQDLVQGMMGGIVGFKLKIDRIEGKWKLSQNHPEERRQRVISRLEQMSGDASQVAEWMKRAVSEGGKP